MRLDRWLVVGVLFWAGTAIGPVGLALWRTHHDPGVAFLRNPEGAAWVVVDRPFQPNPRLAADHVFFLKPFDLAREEQIVLTVHAPGSWTVLLDGVVRARGATDQWRAGEAVDLGPVSAGPHELAIEVRHNLGASALAVRGTDASTRLATPEGWLATVDGSTPVGVRRASDRMQPEVAKAFPTTPSAFSARVEYVLGVALLVGLAHWLFRRRPWPPASWGVVVGLGTAVVAVWTARALSLNPQYGFDAAAHHAYLAFIIDRRALPTANDGWQMFQPPLFYLLAAPLYAAGRALGGDWSVVLARLIPLLSGLGLTAVLARTLSLANATTWSRQRAFVIMACLPMSLTMFRFNGNEPLAGFLTATAVWMALAMRRDGMPRRHNALWLGVVAGLATLAKVSAIVVAPTLALALLTAPGEARPTWTRVARILVVAAGLLGTCGWWFVRNVVLLGHPFVGGWAPSRTVAWWQDPGFRTVNDFATFGESLVRPVFSSVSSVWDGLYSTFWFDGSLSGRASAAGSPPWDWTSLTASVPISILLALVIGVGLLVAFKRRDAEGVVAAACVMAWLAAIASLALTLPIFSTAKASYMLGIVPCFAVLLAFGLDTLVKPQLRFVADVIIAIWLALVLRGLW